MSEMADAVRRMAARVRIPVIADGDTGYGDLHNVQRTVEAFEAAGAGESSAVRELPQASRKALRDSREGQGGEKSPAGGGQGGCGTRPSGSTGIT
jgi:hypothetical protein